MPRFLAILALIGITLAALGGAFFSELAPLLQLDRAHPDLYRLLTAHLVHWTPQHLFWDLATFILLSLWLIGQSPVRYLAALTFSSLTISAAILVLVPSLQTYRGLSGVDCALAALALAQYFRSTWQSRHFPKLVLASLALAALLAKTAYDLSGHPALFAGELGPTVTPVPLAHLLGIATGVGAGLFSGGA